MVRGVSAGWGCPGANKQQRQQQRCLLGQGWAGVKGREARGEEESSTSSTSRQGAAATALGETSSSSISTWLFQDMCLLPLDCGLLYCPPDLPSCTALDCPPELPS
jgi:hypothetical protein